MVAIQASSGVNHEGEVAVKEALIRILADGKFCSGAALGERLGVSRSAIWKHIQALADYQLDVHAVSGKGYRLSQPVELLARETILKQLLDLDCCVSPELDILFDVDSTNRYLLDKSKFLPKSHAVCIAEHQYSGRGRRGKQWVSPFGSNLYCSILWRSNLSLSALSCIGLIVGIAVARTLFAIGLNDHQIKWPNDIIWKNKKLAGILIEATGEVSGPSAIVVGVGINVNMPVSATDDIDQPWVDLASALNKTVSRNALSALLVANIFNLLDQFEKHGFEAFQDEWASIDLLQDKPVVLHLGSERIKGHAVGIDNNGALLVRSETGVIKRYFSGEVSVRYDV